MIAKAVTPQPTASCSVQLSVQLSVQCAVVALSDTIAANENKNSKVPGNGEQLPEDPPPIALEREDR